MTNVLSEILVYTDASIFDDTCLIGYIIEETTSSSSSFLIEEKIYLYEEPIDGSTTGELLAIFCALEKCVSLGIPRVVLFTDASSMTPALLKIKTGNHDKITNSFSKTQRKWAGKLLSQIEIDIQIIGRDANWIVHGLIESVRQEMTYDKTKHPSVWRIDSTDKLRRDRDSSS